MNVDYGVSRYTNIGGYTCYMNSILAVLQQTPLFADYIVCGEFIIDKTKSEIKDTVTFQLHKLFKKSLSNNDSVLTASSFYKTISKKNDMWGERSHQDTQEFLCFLLNSIEEEVCEKVNFIGGRNISINNKLSMSECIQNIVAQKKWEQFVKNEFSPIKTMFTGLLKSSTKCDKCSYTFNSYDTFQCLQLSIPENDDITLYDCLNHYTDEEQLDDDNRITCDFCLEKNNSYKSHFIKRTPKILVIQLKRFKVNMYGQVCGKNTKFVDYPLNKLDLTNYSNDTKNMYNLFAVNLHHPIGVFNSINFGHYTSVVKNRINNKWYHYDDDSKVEYINDVDDIVNNKAALLFYLREE